jgi:hypothetical protein
VCFSEQKASTRLLRDTYQKLIMPFSGAFGLRRIKIPPEGLLLPFRGNILDNRGNFGSVLFGFSEKAPFRGEMRSDGGKLAAEIFLQ